MNLNTIGRIFYGIAIAGLGFQTLYEHDFPYMMIPPKHSWIPVLIIFAYTFGVLFVLAGTCIAFKIKTKSIALILGTALLLIFCFYYIPYELLFTSKYMHLSEWDSAGKELALSSGAFIIASTLSDPQGHPHTIILAKLIPLGLIFFSITMISFGILHLLYAKDVLIYAPSWVPRHLFWIYFPGIVLISSGLEMLLDIRRRIMAGLLGTMIFTWFIILHIPKVIAAPVAEIGGELTSALLALAYSGIAFVLAGIIRPGN